MVLLSTLLSLGASHIFDLHLEYKSYSKQGGFFPPTAVQVSNSHNSLFISAVMQDSDIHQPTETLCSGFLLWEGLQRIERPPQVFIPHVWERNSAMKRKNKKYIFHLYHYFRQDCFFSESAEVPWREREKKP